MSSAATTAPVTAIPTPVANWEAVSTSPAPTVVLRPDRFADLL